MSYRVLIFGSRDWTDEFPIWCVLNGYQSDQVGIIVIQGGAPGADTLAKRWANLNREPCETLDADWTRHGKAAGPIRNQRQVEEGKPEVAWGFVTKPLPQSRGSADMARRLRDAGIPCYIVTGSAPS